MRCGDIAELEPSAFCYWLQGAIEIGGLETLSRKQAGRVFRTLANMEKHNVFTLQSLLLLGSMPPEIAFVHINRELQKVFIHDIDNSYEGDQEFFHLLHQGKAEVI